METPDADRAIEDLSDALVAALRQRDDYYAEALAYREVAVVAIERLRLLQQQLARARDLLREYRETMRRYTARQVGDEME